MRTRHGWMCILGILVVFAHASPVRSEDPPSVEAAELSRLQGLRFWWDGLELPDLSEGRYVRVYGRGMPDRFRMAILREDPPHGSRLLYATLQEDRVEHAPGAIPGWVVPAQLPVDLDGILEGSGCLGDRPWDPLGLDRTPKHSSVGLFWALAALGRGHEDLAIRVCRRIWRNRTDGTIQRDVARGSLHAWERAVASGEDSWAELARRWQVWRLRFAATWPRLDRHDAAAIQRVGREGTGYDAEPDATPGGAAWDATRAVFALPVTRRRVSLFGLFERQEGWHGRSSRLDDPGAEPDPVDRLLRSGHGAVPALLGALDDRRPTRSTSHYSGFTKGGFRHSPSLLTVGEVARLTLEEIAGRRFAPPGGDPQRPTVREQVESWWASARQEGELQSLLRGLLRKRIRLGQLRILIHRYPDEALEPIQRAIWSQGADLGRSLVGLLSELRTEACTSHLLTLLASESQGMCIAAARALHAHDRPEGLATLLRQWPASLVERRLHVGGVRGDCVIRDHLMALLTMDRSAAVAHLDATLPDTPPELQRRVLDAVRWTVPQVKGATRLQQTRALLIGILLGNDARDAIEPAPIRWSPDRMELAIQACETLDHVARWTSSRDVLTEMPSSFAGFVGLVNDWRAGVGRAPWVPAGLLAPADGALVAEWVDHWVRTEGDWDAHLGLGAFGSDVHVKIREEASGRTVREKRAVDRLLEALSTHGVPVR